MMVRREEKGRDLEFREDSSKHRSKGDSSSSFDDGLLLLDKTQNSEGDVVLVNSHNTIDILLDDRKDVSSNLFDFVVIPMISFKLAFFFF